MVLPEEEMTFSEMGKPDGNIDESGKYGKPKLHDPDFQGPLKNRSCTDVICLLLFVAFLAGWGVVAYFAFSNGNWDALVNPTDSYGNICGTKNDNRKSGPNLTNRTYLLYFDLSKCVGPQLFFQGCRTPAVCVEKCPAEFWSPGLPGSPVCLDGYQTLVRNQDSVCAPYLLPSGPVAGRCIPGAPNPDAPGKNTTFTEADALAAGLNVNFTAIQEGKNAVGKYLSARSIVDKIFQDFAKSWPMILIGLIATMVISFIWIVIMRWVAGPMIYLGMLAVIGLLSYGTYYTFSYWQMLKQKATGPDPPFEFTLDAQSYLNRQDTWLAFGIICAVVLGIVLLIGLFLRNRIRLAIALLREASKGVGYMMFTLLFPMFPFILQLAVFGFFGLLAILLSSTGDPKGILVEKSQLTVSPSSVATISQSPVTPEPCDLLTFARSNLTHDCLFSAYNRETKYTYFQLFNVFALFWVGFFVVGLGDMSLAGAFATYYWTRDKNKDLPMFPVSGSVGRTFRYHLGTIAFGSLIIAIVRFIRWLLEKLDQSLKQSHLGIARFFVKCCACCLWCLEKFLKFVNRNAYIMVAIYGKNFCRSARDAFNLLMRNILRVVVLDKVTDFLLFLGKLVIVGGVGVAAFFFFSGRIPGLERFAPKLNYYFVPAITVMLGSYLISSAFFGVYAMAVDTLFLCFLEDLERNDGSPNRPYFMSKNLMKILGKKNKGQRRKRTKTTPT